MPPLARDIMPAMASFTEEEADLSCCAGMGLRETVVRVCVSRAMYIVHD